MKTLTLLFIAFAVLSTALIAEERTIKVFPQVVITFVKNTEDEVWLSKEEVTNEIWEKVTGETQWTSASYNRKTSVSFAELYSKGGFFEVLNRFGSSFGSKEGEFRLPKAEEVRGLDDAGGSDDLSVGEFVLDQASSLGSWESGEAVKRLVAMSSKGEFANQVVGHSRIDSILPGEVNDTVGFRVA
ncbi:MAG: hypothetical protein AAF226_14995, partial [Verrucomicrobiota bacterium]